MKDRYKELTDKEIVKFLLFQQFYYGNDIIYGRTREISEHISGSGEVIENFLKILLQDIDLIRNNQFHEYIENFSQKFININHNAIYDRFRLSYDNLEESKTSQLITSLLIGELLMAIRKDCFDEILNEIRIVLIERLTKLKKKEHREINGKLQKMIDEKMAKLTQLFALNSKDISIIYNLSFLQVLAFKLGNFKVYKNTKKILLKYMDNIIELLAVC